MDVERVVREHLPPAEAAALLALGRPALRLTPTAGPNPVYARLGGLPRLPADLAWPEWPGHGPLSYVGEVHCGLVARHPIGVTVPPTGRLLFFWFDGSYGDGTVGYWEPESIAGSRVVYVADGVDCAPREIPEGVDAFDEGVFGGTETLTFDEDAEMPEELADALDRTWGDSRHQIGGAPYAVQGPVEHEIAEFAMALRDDAAPSTGEEGRRWSLLLQVDSDDALDMMWGDAGLLYWYARAGQPVAPDEVLFTWQCC